MLVFCQAVAVYFLVWFWSQSFGAPFSNGLYSQIFVTAVVCFLASISGYLIIRQLASYPGAKTIAYFIPGMLLSYVLFAGGMLAFRFEYSRTIALACFFAAQLWLHFDYFVRERYRILNLNIVPGGDLRNISSLPNINWQSLNKPADHSGKVDAVIADLNFDHLDSWERYIGRCILAGIPIYDVKSVIETLTGRVNIEQLSENSFGGVLPSITYLRVKREIDLVLAVLALPIVIPLIVVAGALIKLESKGPIFFTQTRLGYRGREFKIYKLRSMYIDQDDGSRFTTSGDTRITRTGKFIRKYRVDELPQILNIIKGEMSWIGPRPEAIELANWYANEIPYYLYRHAVRPGISGWAQVNQGNVAEIEAVTIKLQYDFYYIKHFSPWLDILVLLKSFRIVLTGLGSK